MAAWYAGAAFEDVQYEAHSKEGGWDRSEWFSVKPELQAKNGLINLPYVDDDGFIVTQSNACLTYLGRKFGLLGQTDKEMAYVEQCLSQIMDLRNSTVGLCYNQGSDKAAIQRHLDGAVSMNYSKLESFMQQLGKKYLTSDSLTVADFHMFEMIDQHERMAKFYGQDSPVGAFPGLKGLYEAVKAEPKLAGYFGSSQYALPQNNKMAVYGGSIEDGR